MAGLSGITSLGGISKFKPNVNTADTSTWTLAVIPDTQRLAPNNATAYNDLIQWIVDNETTEDIRMVIHLGDYVNNGASSSEWNVAETAMERLLNNDIPLIHCAGNHDYDDDGMGTYSRKTATYWETKFPASDWSGYSWYVDEYENITTNQAATITVGNTKYLFLTLEIFPRAGVFSWANGIITAQSPDRIIVGTHMMVNEDGDLQVYDGDSPDIYGICNNSTSGDCATGADIYNDFIAQHENIILVCNGHDVDTTYSNERAHAIRTSTVNGKTINQHLFNFQNDSSNSYADSAYLRLYKFDHSDNSCDVTTYNPVQDTNHTDSENQFTFNYS